MTIGSRIQGCYGIERLFEHGRKLLSQTITGRWPAKLQTKNMGQPDDQSVIVVLNFWEVTD
jgi:hypothetical protein